MGIKRTELVSLDVPLSKNEQVEIERLRQAHPRKKDAELYKMAVVNLRHPEQRHVRIDAAKEDSQVRSSGEVTSSGTWMVSASDSPLMKELLAMERRMNELPGFKPSKEPMPATQKEEVVRHPGETHDEDESDTYADEEDV